MVYPLKSEERSLIEINSILNAVFDVNTGAVRVAVMATPISNPPITATNIYQDLRPKPLQQVEVSLLKINNSLTNIISTNGVINAIILT